MKKFAILILNWNSIDLTVDCIKSILRSKYENYEIYCLDNGSKKREDLILKKIFGKNKKIKVLRVEKNLGFAEGNNYVFSKINKGFDFVFLLNNDTIVNKKILGEINKGINFINDPKLAVVSPIIFYYNKKLTTKSPWWPKKSLKKPTKVRILKGCAMIIRQEVIKNKQIFDPKFFAYMEEIDFLYKKSKEGYHFYYIPRAKIWHKVIPHKDSSLKTYLISRNKWLFWKNMRIADKILYFIYLLFFCNPIKFLNYIVNKKNLKFFIKGNIDGLIWIITGKEKKLPHNIFIK
jgi:GT2 family glycosyltransferase